jgi:hypothetical protein
MTSLPPPTPAANRLAWLKPLNATLSAWAATLSWWRMAGLALIVLIAGSWIADTLQLTHETVRKPRPSHTVSVGGVGQKDAKLCDGEEIHIGGDKGIVIREAGCKPGAPASPASAANPAPAASATSASSASASAPSVASATPVSESSVDSDTDASEKTTATIRHTLGGWINDVLSALLVAFFAYLAAAKIIVRKTAESDAKLRVANDSAEREAMQRQLVQARLKLLQAQVEPHFLFNTLAAVDYLIETDPKRASEMQKVLISYLRAALPQMRQESSTLGRELALIRPYLELLKLRIEDRLSYEILVPANLESTVFPPMVLQTLVENAIKHGIEPKPEGGRVTVSAQVLDGQLHVDVMDTGVGLRDGDIFAPPGQNGGLGLDNIRNRLSMLYPGTSRMELRSGSNGGTLVRLSIPYQTELAAQGDNKK